MSIIKSWTVVLVNLLTIKMRELSPRKLKDISLNFQDFVVKLSCKSFIDLKQYCKNRNTWSLS